MQFKHNNLSSFSIPLHASGRADKIILVNAQLTKTIFTPEINPFLSFKRSNVSSLSIISCAHECSLITKIA